MAPLPALGLSDLKDRWAFTGFDSLVSIVSFFFFSFSHCLFLEGAETLRVQFELLRAERFCLWKMNRTKLEDSGWKTVQRVQHLWL